METRNSIAIYGARPVVLLDSTGRRNNKSKQAQEALEAYLAQEPAHRPNFAWGERGYRLIVRVPCALAGQLTEERVRRVRQGLPDGLSDILHDALGFYLGVRP